MSKSSIQRAFNRKAESPNAPFDLAAEVADAYRRHPELDGNTYFVDASKGRVIHPKADEAMQSKIFGNELAAAAIEIRSKAKRSGGFISRHLPFRVYCIYLEGDSPSLSVNAFPPGYTERQKRTAVFDHEMGHALTMRTMKEAQWLANHPRIMEGAAEVHALMRQFQRYGNDNPIVRPKQVIGLNAAFGVFGDDDDSTYFCAPALEKVLSIRDGFNLARFTPAETAAVALGIAVKHAVADDDMARIRDELGGGLNVKRLAEGLKTTTSPDSFEWGLAGLTHMMSRYFRRGPGQLEKFRTEEWPQLKQDLKAREKQGLRPPAAQVKKAA